MGNEYIVKNRWYHTCSKHKLYMQSKEAYKKVYIDEVDISFLSESTSLRKWDMLDKFILTPDKFDSEYSIPAGKWTISDLKDECLKRNIPIDPKDKKEDLESKLYWNTEVITKTEYQMLLSMDSELKRQPLFDYNWEYQKQVELIVEYNGIKLKWSIDRLSVEKWLIRDLKTTSDMQYNPWNSKTYFEDKLTQNDQYEYWLQLAWYFMLVYIHSWKECTWIIDAVSSTWNYAYEAYSYSPKVLKQIMVTKLFPTLDQFIIDTKNNTFVDDVLERGPIINNRYYPILDSAIQKEFVEIIPAFY